MESIQQSLGISNYYFTQPYKLSKHIGFVLNVSFFSSDKCPFYAPICKYGMCRLCHQLPSKHKKYYIFSNYARKIQKRYLKYLFTKKNRGNYVIFKKYKINYVILHKILEYKLINYRKYTFNKYF